VLDRVPERGETLVGDRFRVDAGGKGSNQAVGVARLGAASALLTAVGEDAFAAEARVLWADEGVDAGAVVTVPGAATMVGAIFVERDGENRIVVAMGALDALGAGHVHAFEQRIAAADVCLVGLEIPVAPAREALATARRRGVATVLNPAPAPREPVDDLLALADWVTPNESEAAALAGGPGTPEQLAERLRTRGATGVVLTLGAEGALLVDAEGSRRVPALPVPRVVDSTGAGDAFNAAFAVALAEGRTPLEACRLGCAAGAFMVQAAGVIPGMPRRRELIDT
jgi:ribokinase